MSDAAYICETCGVQYRPSAAPPASCPICEDERQYVGHAGQQWTTSADLSRRGHRNRISEEEPGLASIHTEPDFGIGQRAFLVQTPEGNLLWDCVALLDAGTIAAVQALGGVRAIAISHPHYYATMAEWSVAFGNAPVYIHEADRQWVMRRHGATQFWGGDHFSLFGGLALHRTGGHFTGFQVAHWPAGAEGRGVLLAGDQPQVCADPRWVSFLYSYPNFIPLGPRAVRDIAWTLAAVPFDRLYGPFPGRLVKTGAQEAVARSAERYLRAIGFA